MKARSLWQNKKATVHEHSSIHDNDTVNGNSYKIDWLKFGASLKFHRKRRGLQQRELAEKLGVKVNTISRLEIGSITCGLDLMLSLCDALHITPDSLLVGNYRAENSPHYDKFLDVKHRVKDALIQSLEEYFD